MQFDELANWNPHSKELTQRCEKRIQIMRAVSGLKWGASRSTLLKIYRALIRPLLDHGCEGLEYATKEVKAALESIQNKALAICCGSMKGTPTSALQVECGEPPLDLRRRRLATNLAAKVKLLRKHPLRQTYFLPSSSPLWLKEREKKLKAIMDKRNPGGYGPDRTLLKTIFKTKSSGVSQPIAPSSSTTIITQPQPISQSQSQSQSTSHITMESIKLQTNLKLVSDWQARWDTGTTGRALREIEVDVQPGRRIQTNQREKEVLTFRLKSGHCRLNGPLNKIGGHPTGRCDHCKDAIEDRKHFLMECPAREELHKALIEANSEPLTIKNILENPNNIDIIHSWVKANVPGGL